MVWCQASNLDPECNEQLSSHSPGHSPIKMCGFAFHIAKKKIPSALRPATFTGLLTLRTSDSIVDPVVNGFVVLLLRTSTCSLAFYDYLRFCIKYFDAAVF